MLKMCCSCHKDAKKLLRLPFSCLDPEPEADHTGPQNPSSIGQCLELPTEPTSQDTGLFKGRGLFLSSPSFFGAFVSDCLLRQDVEVETPTLMWSLGW